MKFTTSEPFFELQLSCMDRLQLKIYLNYKCHFLRSPWHLKAQIRKTLRTLILLSKSGKLEELIVYFRSYSSLGDERFFVSPYIISFDDFETRNTILWHSIEELIVYFRSYSSLGNERFFCVTLYVRTKL